MSHTGHTTSNTRRSVSMAFGLLLAVATFLVGDSLEPHVGGIWQMLVAVVSAAALVSIPLIVWMNRSRAR